MEDKLSVLRECYRILRPGGRMAGYVIHTPAGISAAQAARAGELGPTYVSASDMPGALARRAGFVVHASQDVTPAFRATCSALLRARHELELELRTEEGDAYFEQARTAKANMLAGIDRGLLLRSLVIVEKPG